MFIHPSILSADFANLETELSTISAADAIHVDVMDNHFVPNLTFGTQMVGRLQEVSKRELDVHLMITDADRWAPDYAELGVASVTFHIEASKNPVDLARSLRRIGSKAAVAIKPGTDVSAIEELLTEVDMVLIMTVEPGFGGQKLIPETVGKVSQIRAALRARGLELMVQVDGGVTEENIAELAKAGANSFVAGSAVFKSMDRNVQIDKLRALAMGHHHG
jgi:ribulose-phosphate 3-epimerase